MDGASCSRYSRSDWSQAWTRAESSQSMVSSDFSPLLCICVCVCVCARARARACALQFLTSLNLQHSHATAMHVCIGQVTLACSLLLLTPCTPATAHHVQCDTKKTKNWEFGRGQRQNHSEEGLGSILWISHRPEAAGAGSAGMASATKPISLKALSPYEQQQALGVIPPAKPWTLSHTH